MYYKVVTNKLQSLGLRKNPTILTFGYDWIYEKHPIYSSGDGGGIWVTGTLSNAIKLKKYFEKRYGKARVFECEIGDVLYKNSYRIKTDKIKLIREYDTNRVQNFGT
jgi:hypothetical protein